MAKNHRNQCQLGLRTWSFPQYRSVGPRFFNILWTEAISNGRITHWWICLLLWHIGRAAIRSGLSSLSVFPWSHCGSTVLLHVLRFTAMGNFETSRRWLRNHYPWSLDSIAWRNTFVQNHWMGPLPTPIFKMTIVFYLGGGIFYKSGKKTTIMIFGKPSPGIFPDYMHIMHLACSVDAICSMLLDLTDGGNRDQQLSQLWESYRKWCEDARFLDQTTIFLGEPKSCLKMIRLKKSTVNYLWICAYEP